MALEGALGLGIYDFVSRHASDYLKKGLTKQRVKFEPDSLVLMAKAEDTAGINTAVTGLLEDGSKESVVHLLRHYFDIRNVRPFTREELLQMASVVVDHDLARHREYVDESSRPGWREVLRTRLERGFVPDLLNICKEAEVVKPLARSLGNLDNGELMIRMYQEIGDEAGLVEYAQTLPFHKAMQILEIVKDSTTRVEATRQRLVGSRKNARSTLGYVLQGTMPQQLLADGLASELEVLADAAAEGGQENSTPARVYKLLQKDATDDRQQELHRKIEDLVYACIDRDHPDLTSFWKITEHLDASEELEEKVLAKADDFLRKEVREGEIKRFKLMDHLYKFAGHGYENADKRAGDICMEEDRPDLAIPFYEKLKKGQQLVFDAAITLANQGKTAEAFEVFERTDFRKVEAGEEFYKVMGASILSLFLDGNSIDAEEVRDIYNRRIKPGLVKSIVANGEENLKLRVVFDKHEVTYTQQKVTVPSRNEVRVFSQKGLGNDESVWKFYEDPVRGEAEAYWLRYLEGHVPVKRLLASGRVGNIHLNQIEKSSGQRFDLAARTEDAFRQAIDTSVKIFEVANGSTPATVRKSLSDAYLRERFEQFYQNMEDIGGDMGLVRAIQDMEDEVCSVLQGNIIGVVPNDYTPRNLMVEGVLIVPIDHEGYIEGHPITPVLTLVKNAENCLGVDQERSLIAYGAESLAERGITTSPSLVWASNLFYDVRRGRTLAKHYFEGIGNGDTVQELQWFLDDMRGIIDGSK